MIRRQAAARDPHQDLVWQPRFAYTSAGVILAALTVVSLPIWVVFYRMTDPTINHGAGPRVADLVALSMMLLGGLVTGGAAWVIIIEMRGRVRMVDRLARTSERDLRPSADFDLVALGPAPSDEVTQVITAPGRPTPEESAADDEPAGLDSLLADGDTLLADEEGTPADDRETRTFRTGERGVDATVPAQRDGSTPTPPAPPPFVPRSPVSPLPTQATAVPGGGNGSVPATLEASSHLLHSFSRVLRAFSQLPAQVALLAVALSLFVGATVLSLH